MESMKTTHDQEVPNAMTTKQFSKLITEAVEATRHMAPAGAFDPKALASYLRIDASTALRWLESGILPPPMTLDPPGRDGSVGIRRWTRPMIDAWLELGCPSCEPPCDSDFTQWRHDWVCEDLSRRMWTKFTRNETMTP